MEDTPRNLFLDAIAGAVTRPAGGKPGAALHGFLTLTAGYFLQEWLPAEAHARLVRRLAGELDGLADLEPPANVVHATQLAQHVRELAAEFGPTPWLERLAGQTATLVPAAPEEWDDQVRAAAAEIAGGGGGDALLLGHARRRLWTLTMEGSGAAEMTLSAAARQSVERIVEMGDGQAIHVAEALLAESGLPAALRDAALAALVGRSAKRALP